MATANPPPAAPQAPAVPSAEEAREAYLADPKTAHLDQLSHLNQAIRTAVTSLSADVRKVAADRKALWEASGAEEQHLVNDLTSGISSVVVRWGSPTQQGGGIIRRVQDALNDQQTKAAAHLTGESFEPKFHITKMEQLRSILTELRSDTNDIVQILEAKREMLGENGQILRLHSILVGILIVFDYRLKWLLQTTGRIRAIEIGLRAVARREKKEWEEEMMLTMLVPVADGLP